MKEEVVISCDLTTMKFMKVAHCKQRTK